MNTFRLLSTGEMGIFFVVILIVLMVAVVAVIVFVERRAEEDPPFSTQKGLSGERCMEGRQRICR